MPPQHRQFDSDNRNLSVVLHDSPGSSVFDLPTQPSIKTLNQVPLSQYPSSHQSYECPNDPSFLVISGGTGGNAICSAFTNACYVLPVSDDGGSSSEIIRVLGGPSIGQLDPVYSPCLLNNP